MEPVTVTVVTALAAGATAVANGIASAAGKDLFERLKGLISDRYAQARAFLEAVESDPASLPEKQVLTKQLRETGADTDHELKKTAQALLDALGSLREDPRAQALFDFDQLRVARDMQFEDIEAAQVMRVSGTANIEGNFIVKGIRQVQAKRTPQKN